MSPAAFSLTGRVALVTGAARGLGQALARGFAEAGADIVALDKVPLDDTQAQIMACGRRCVPLCYDLIDSSPEMAAEVVRRGVAELGQLDIVMNNAGIIRRRPIVDVGPEEWADVLQVNLTSALYFGQAAARYWIASDRGGKIINMASMLSFQGGLFVPAYTASKSALAGLTRAMATEWAGKGINVNAIAPGYMVTDLTTGLRDDPERAEAILRRIPAGRWGQPTDVQGAAVFLASEAASYMHGAIIPVDGGWLAS